MQANYVSWELMKNVKDLFILPFNFHRQRFVENIAIKYQSKSDGEVDPMSFKCPSYSSSVRIRSFSGPYFPLFSANAGKCGP